MSMNDPRNWMWSEALEMLARADRLHREMFQPARRAPCWEPPVDVLETDERVLVLVALPGVNPKQVQLAIQNGELLISGERLLPPELRTAVIHRLELPQGRFERRIKLPPGRYNQPASAAVDGCVLINLPKVRP